MIDPKDSLIEYPSDFPIKVMGPKVDHFVHTTGKYLGVTLTIRATSREQLDGIYQTLSTHPMVKVVL